MAACTQACATAAGVEVLQKGGNAADAAVAMAAALAVSEVRPHHPHTNIHAHTYIHTHIHITHRDLIRLTARPQPTSTGLGGDAFFLYYDAATQSVKALNGSGRTPGNLDTSAVCAEHEGEIRLPSNSVHAVTVPGAAAAWCDAVGAWGSGMEMKEILEPAIRLAAEGYPVGDVTGWAFAKEAHKLVDERNVNGKELLDGNGNPPVAGDVMVNPGMARVLETLAEGGKEAFYTGWIAESIVETLAPLGSAMTMEDLAGHDSEMVDPISVSAFGVDLYECPPNGQGLVALVALNILAPLEEELKQAGHNSSQYLHILIEALRIAFAVAGPCVAEPDTAPSFDHLLQPQWGAATAQTLDLEKAASTGAPAYGSDTVYFCVVDNEGNAASVVNSNYEGLGSGLVPKGTGFPLQNRGRNFVLPSAEGSAASQQHPNVLGPSKRSYHTIIPALALDSESHDLYAAMGVMGGFMQPAGHVQVLLNMTMWGMDPQQALDAPRICIDAADLVVPSDAVESRTRVFVEAGITPDVVERLEGMGHWIECVDGNARAVFGRGQIIRPSGGMLHGGSDCRGDGCAFGLY